jgi:hypothetical protein
MKSNGTCSLVCTLTNTTPLKFSHTNTQRQKNSFTSNKLKITLKTKNLECHVDLKFNFLTLWHTNIPRIDIQQAINKAENYRLQFKTNLISNVSCKSPHLL